MDDTTEIVLGGLVILVGTGLIIVLAYLAWLYLLICILVAGGLIGVALAIYHFRSVLLEAHRNIK